MYIYIYTHTYIHTHTHTCNIFVIVHQRYFYYNTKQTSTNNETLLSQYHHVTSNVYSKGIQYNGAKRFKITIFKDVFQVFTTEN
jgi:hypothetical protein